VLLLVYGSGRKVLESTFNGLMTNGQQLHESSLRIIFVSKYQCLDTSVYQTQHEPGRELQEQPSVVAFQAVKSHIYDTDVWLEYKTTF
jgi:hypothetical protein